MGKALNPEQVPPEGGGGTERSVAREYYPKLLTIKNMQVTTSRRREADGKGGTREMTVRSYHCETCHCFVRSETSEAEASTTGS